MKKNRQFVKVVWSIMKITLPSICLLLASFGFSMAGNGQEILDKRLSLNANNVEFKELLGKIEKSADVKFSFMSHQIPSDEKVSITAYNEKLESILKEMFQPLKIHYEIVGKYIVLKKEITSIGSPLAPKKFQLYSIVGKVTDNKGEALAGTTITLSPLGKSLIVENNGTFVFKDLPDGSYTLTLTSMGFKTEKKVVSVSGKDASLNVTMQEDNLQLDQIVVTSSGSAKKKIESSVAITTVSAKQLEERPPLNSTDMIKAIPGMSVESSGGDGPGSVRVRGLPGGGYVFLGVMEDGLPVLPTGYTTNPSPDQLYKVDLNIRNVEAVRGGHAAVILAGTPGALINVLSNTGGNKLGGKVKYTRGLTQNANRFDATIGGPLSDRWKFNIGGFFRTDEGARPPSFRANEGGQIKANLTYDLKKGSYLRLYGKYLNDRTTWLVPSYYSYDGSGQGKTLPDFDLLKEILTTRDTRVTLKSPDGRTFDFDFADGVHTKSAYGQAELKIITEKEWIIRNNMRYQVSESNFTGSTVTAATAYNPGVNYYYLDGQQLINPTGYYTGQSFTGSMTDDRQFVNNLDFFKQFGNHGLSFGASVHFYDVNNFGLGATFNTEIKNQPRILRIGTNQGNGYTGVNIGSYRDGSTTIASLMASDEVTFGNLTVDLGVRVDNFKVKGERLINSAPFTNTTPYDESKLHSTGSLGLNYKLSETQALFARATKTYSALNVGNYSAFNYNPDDQKRRDIVMAEVGYKVNTQKVGFFGSLVYASLNNIAASMGIPNKTGGIINIGTFASSRNLSAELEAIYTPVNNLNFKLTTTFQSSTFTEYSVIAPDNARDDLAGKPFIWDGNSAERIPNYMADLAVSYKYRIFDLFVSYRQIGKRWTTPSNVYRLNGYNEISAGLDVRLMKNLGLRVWGDNLANSRGLTEGNIRGDQFLINGDFPKGSLQIGRIILPRSIWSSLTFSF
jgi:iron complex outermembrane receptor protein